MAVTQKHGKIYRFIIRRSCNHRSYFIRVALYFYIIHRSVMATPYSQTIRAGIYGRNEGMCARRIKTRSEINKRSTLCLPPRNTSNAKGKSIEVLS